LRLNSENARVFKNTKEAAHDVYRYFPGFHSGTLYFYSGFFDLSKSGFPSGLGFTGFFAGFRHVADFSPVSAFAVAQSAE
jgi:hypothetical protein